MCFIFEGFIFSEYCWPCMSPPHMDVELWSKSFVWAVNGQYEWLACWALLKEHRNCCPAWINHTSLQYFFPGSRFLAITRYAHSQFRAQPFKKSPMRWRVLIRITSLFKPQSEESTFQYHRSSTWKSYRIALTRKVETIAVMSGERDVRTNETSDYHDAREWFHLLELMYIESFMKIRIATNGSPNVIADWIRALESTN